MAVPNQHRGERGIRDQIARYRTAFIAVVAMIVLAVLVGGYILSQERLSLPGWVPVLGKSYFTLEGDFSTAQALTPGQGQAVTIAGAKIGEIARVEEHAGDALVTMNLAPKYARYIYRNATLLMRPKTQLNDMTIEVDPGTPSAGRIRSGYMVPLSQTAPNVNLDEFLSALDAETRAYLQELLAGVGEGLKGNARNLSATFKRFDPIARDLRAITSQLHLRSRNIERAIHNFQLVISAFGGKDAELAQLIDSSNAVFKTFAEQDQAWQSTLRLLPGALSKTRRGLGKLATAAEVVRPALQQLEPWAKALAPAERASRPFFAHTTPVFKNEIRPFARRFRPVVEELQPTLKPLDEALPGLSTTFTVFNEFVNELAFNPGPRQPGFMFFVDWGIHDLNSAVSTADAHGPLGRTLVYFNCNVLPLLNGVASINNTVKLAVALLKPPTGEECVRLGLISAASAPSATTKATASRLRRDGAFGLLGAGLLGSGSSAFARLANVSGGDR
jgi:phospholipid/cholesterol/gamma-HCH transport system substrate-binding protein